MAFDFKKEYKEFYMPKNRPEIVTVPILRLHETNDIIIALSDQRGCHYGERTASA